MPRSPLWLFSEFGGRLSNALFECPRESLWPFISARQRDIDDLARVAKCKLIGGALQTIELDVSIYADPEQQSELPMEMIFRKCGNAAEPLDRKIIVQVIINVVEHRSESDAIALCGC